MIRINLLAVERKTTSPAADLGQRITVGCSLLLVATAVLLGWRYWSLRQESARIDADIVTATAETERLRSVLAQVAEFEKRKTQLQERVALIEELRKGQNAPVHMLDELSRAVPDRLWLTQLQQKNNELKIDGRTTSLTALSDFVGNLEASGYFARPVEILDSQVEGASQQAQSVAGDVVKFSVKAQFAMPGGTPAPPAAGAGPATPASSRPAERARS